MRSLKPYLELVRFPNLFTAMADVLAGAWIVGMGVATLTAFPLAALLLSSACLYAMGTVLNDVFDFDEDKRDRPERPLPSGRIRYHHAWVLAVILGLLGLGFSVVSGWLSFILASLLVIFILLYDCRLKQYECFGSLTMGGCRALNLLLGMSLIPFKLSEYGWLCFLGLLYIFAVTFLSKGETGKSTHPYRVRVMMVTACLCLMTMGVMFIIVGGSLIHAIGCVVFAFWMFWALAPAIKKPTSEQIRRAVGLCVLGLVWLDAGVATLFGGFLAFITIGVCLGLSYVFSRFFSVT